MTKIITSGITRETEKEYGKISDRDSFSIYYNKAVYRFVYELDSKSDVDRFLKDFKAMKFENCDYEETDGGENLTIEYYYEDEEETPVEGKNFVGEGMTENETIDYDYNWLHSITLIHDNKEVFAECGSFKKFIDLPEGKEILNFLDGL